MSELTSVIHESFTQYAGAVLQSRALIDARDGLKPSARQILYTMDMCKYTHDKPFNASASIVGDAMKYFYIHGDSSCLGVVMRAGQPFAMRYPLVEISGNYGTLMESGNWAAARYTKSRLSKISSNLFADIHKNVIEKWRDNFSDTEQYPEVLPTKGFYNLVNGTDGIGIGMASSIPQFNLNEVNKALEILLLNPNASFDEIYCAPDFATGATLLNESEVKQALEKGEGFSCKLRASIDFDRAERALIVTEIPYGVYTNTICGQLEEILESDTNPGIERFNDLTGERPLIKIYLTRTANPDKVIKYLYSKTSLQSFYGINMTMLDKGRFPKVFGWKEALQAHIDHEKEVYRRGFEFDLKKIEDRIHIIDGILICLARIDEVVNTIKSSNSTTAASLALQTNFILDEAQAKAVLEMKLSRLAHLEVSKIENERANLVTEATRINKILTSEELFKNEIINGWRTVANCFGDKRRTKVLNLADDGTGEGAVVEQKQLSVSISSGGAFYCKESSTLYTQNRNGVGTKFKLEDGEYIVNNFIINSNDKMLVFDDTGNTYHLNMGDVVLEEKQYFVNYIAKLDNKRVVAAVPSNINKKYIIFVTKKGIVKKTLTAEYNLTRNVGILAIKLDKDDTIISVFFTDDERLGILSKSGNFIIIKSDDITATGRVTRGVIGMGLNIGDEIVSAKLIPKESKQIVSVTIDGFIKRTDVSEFKVTNRGTKGVKIQSGTALCDFLPISDENEIIITSTLNQLKLKMTDVPKLSRGAQGVKSMKLSAEAKIVKIQAVKI